MVPCQAGNCPQKVSYGSDTQRYHAGLETMQSKRAAEISATLFLLFLLIYPMDKPTACY